MGGGVWSVCHLGVGGKYCGNFRVLSAYATLERTTCVRRLICVNVSYVPIGE